MFELSVATAWTRILW